VTALWTALAGALLVLVAAGSVAAVRGRTFDRVVGLQLVGLLSPLTAVAIAGATGRGVFLEVALALALLALAGSLVYARTLERWL
jgi:multisubunit Na+/H+ antiporter MnhF subunit